MHFTVTGTHGINIHIYLTHRIRTNIHVYVCSEILLIFAGSLLVRIDANLGVFR